MRLSVLLTVLVATLLLVSPILPKIVTAQPSQGNWVVTGTQVVQNESITLDGNLTVESGGSLTLSNDSLIINGQSPGQYSIYVTPGGSIYIYNSTIMASSNTDGYSFVLMGKHVVMKHDRVQGAGWCVGTEGSCLQEAFGFDQGTSAYHYGLEIVANNAVVEENTISHDTEGLELVGANESIQGNTFSSDFLFSIQLLRVSESSILGNIINQSAYQPGQNSFVDSFSNGDRIENNTILAPLKVIGGVDTSPSGLSLGNSWGNTIYGNNFTGNFPISLSDGSSDNTIAGNFLVPYEAGVYVLGGVSNRILNNTVRIAGQSVGCSGSNCTRNGFGFYLSSGHNSTIDGNLVYGQEGVQGFGAVLYGTSGSQLLDNRMVTPNFQTLSLFGSQNNTIRGNVMTNTETGISLDYLSNGNLISDNEVVANYSGQSSGCCSSGIRIHDSSQNNIYGNDFIISSMGRPGPYDNGNNTWYSQSVGNYWSLYSGSGPYPIPPEGEDPFPLSKPVTVAPVRMTNTTFSPRPPNVPSSHLSDVVINNETTTLGAAQVGVSGSMQIVNSVATLGTNGSFDVNLGSGATLTIVNSTVLWYEGSLTVPSGAALVIKDSKLIIGQKGQIRMSLSGSFQIEKSEIRSTPNGFGWYINAFPPPGNSTSPSAVMKDTSFYSYGTSATDLGGPIFITGFSQVDLENDRFAGCNSGLVAGHDSEVRFVNNTFFDVQGPLGYSDTDIYGSNFHYNSTLYIAGNNFNNQVSVIGGSITFTGNNVTGPLRLQGNEITVSENNIYVGGVSLQGQSVSVSGNYWSGYSGSGPYVVGTNADGSQIVDDNPYAQPNGWLAAVVTTTMTTNSESTSQSSATTTSTSTASTATSAYTTSSSAKSGIPEFPFQVLAAAAFTSLVAVSYLLVRRKLVHR